MQFSLLIIIAASRRILENTSYRKIMTMCMQLISGPGVIIIVLSVACTALIIVNSSYSAVGEIVGRKGGDSTCGIVGPGIKKSYMYLLILSRVIARRQAM